jgi:ubiquinone/menaquinone biosynthesis C-methylase UbiE
MKSLRVVGAVGAVVLAWSAVAFGRGRLRTAHDNIRRYSMPGARSYDLATGLLFRGKYRRIAREIAAEAEPGSRLLDVGCGPGEILVELARIAPAIDATGVDVDAAMIARADRKAERAAARHGGSRPRFLVADAAALPFEDGAFDVVVSSFSVHHWPDRDAGLAEVMRVLRPGGKAIVWDIAPPHPTSPTGDASGHSASHHGAPPSTGSAMHAGADDHRPSMLQTLRMVLVFRRIPTNRYDFVKPGA